MLLRYFFLGLIESGSNTTSNVYGRRYQEVYDRTDRTPLGNAAHRRSRWCCSRTQSGQEKNIEAASLWLASRLFTVSFGVQKCKQRLESYRPVFTNSHSFPL